MKKLYCSLRGGLGNQLFQVAYGMALASQYGAELILDDGWFHGRRLPSETPRRFGLGYFRIDCRFPGSGEKLILALIDFALKLQKRLKLRLLPIHFDGLPLPARRLASENVVFQHGCWQSFALVEPIRTQLRRQFRLRDGLFSRMHARRLAEIALCPESVAVHVRRGDYVSSALASVAHGTCSLNYYADALSIVRRRLESPRIYLFSDDLAWAQANLPLDGLSVVAVDSARFESPEFVDLADFDLMCNCRHAVIANSSFSWWAAFLLQTDDSLVIAPRQWFSWGSPSELYGSGWLIL